MRYELYSLICKKCGASNSPDLKACQGCGGPTYQPRRCHYCQKENPPNAYNCIECGRILRVKPTMSIFHWRLPGSVSVIVLLAALSWITFKVCVSWIELFETNLEVQQRNEQILEMQRRHAL